LPNSEICNLKFRAIYAAPGLFKSPESQNNFPADILKRSKKMKSFILIFLAVGCASSVQKQESPEYKISSELYQTYKTPLEKKTNSVEMMVPDAPVINFAKVWKADLGEDFLLRKSFSIPVVSPSEMKPLLQKMKKEEIDDIARSLYLQNSRFNVMCVGKKEIQGHEDYFLVLESEDLTRIRLEIQEVFRLRGGKREHFFPTDYTPLIPLNETSTSLEGLNQKSEKDCRETVKASPPFEGPGPVLSL
jgi:hypothetical protein